MTFERRLDQSINPCVLLVGLLPGTGGMHLPRHFFRSGLQIEFLGTEASMAVHSGFVRKFHPWHTASNGHYLPDALISATQQSGAMHIVPIDDFASELIQAVGRGGMPGHDIQRPLPEHLVELARQSLGNPLFYPLHATRKRAYQTAQRAGIAVPTQVDIKNNEDLMRFASRHAWQVVVKREKSMGGMGTYILRSQHDARVFINKQLIGSSPCDWIAQVWVPGRLGMHAVFAEKGRVLAQVSAVQLVQRSQNPSAPSSVVRLCQHTEMAAAGSAFIAATGASGFHGWDFQLDGNGKAYMIEHNPRPISISHLGGLVEMDLSRSLASTCGKANSACANTEARPYEVALFPDEWQRDANSPWLHKAFHDVPWEDAALLKALLTTQYSYC